MVSWFSRFFIFPCPKCPHSNHDMFSSLFPLSYPFFLYLIPFSFILSLFPLSYPFFLYLIPFLFILSLRSHDEERAYIRTNLQLQVKVKAIGTSRSVLPISPPLPLQCYPHKESHQCPLILGVQRPLLQRRNHQLRSRSLLCKDNWTTDSSLILLRGQVKDLRDPQWHQHLKTVQSSLQLRHMLVSLPQLPLVDGPLSLQPSCQNRPRQQAYWTDASLS